MDKVSRLLMIDPVLRDYRGLLMGIDFGLSRIGVAIGNTHTRQATPVTTVNARQNPRYLQDLKRLIEQWQPEAIVVGIPLNMDDSDQEMTYKARSFARQLKKHCSLPIHGVDERLTSFIVKQTLFESGGYKALKKTAIDPLAAKVMLEEWMQQFIKNDVL